MSPILLIDKPAGMTSHDVVDRVRRILHTRRVGHAGTLDPFATGLLIIGVNEGTKQLAHFLHLDKTYEVTAFLGATTNTFDVEGTITPFSGQIIAPSRIEIERALDTFRGGYIQFAPLFSAKKLQGKKLYELARAGITDESLRPSKEVKIDQLEVLTYEFPHLCLRVRCSSGTYIRSLVDDLGRALGIGAYAKQLRRTAIGEHVIEEAVTLEALATNTTDATLST